MKPTVFYLSTCSTSKRILQLDWRPGTDLELRDIKAQGLSAEELDAMVALAGSHEALFSRRAQAFRRRGLHEQVLKESDYRKLLLEEYTFLKRPVLVLEDRIFIGNAPKTVQQGREALQERALQRT
jgi:arsenate reductase-like glutaredoxin family protein